MCQFYPDFELIEGFKSPTLTVPVGTKGSVWEYLIPGTGDLFTTDRDDPRAMYVMFEIWSNKDKPVEYFLGGDWYGTGIFIRVPKEFVKEADLDQRIPHLEINYEI